MSRGFWALEKFGVKHWSQPQARSGLAVPTRWGIVMLLGTTEWLECTWSGTIMRLGAGNCGRCSTFPMCLNFKARVSDVRRLVTGESIWSTISIPVGVSYPVVRAPRKNLVNKSRRGQCGVVPQSKLCPVP